MVIRARVFRHKAVFRILIHHPNTPPPCKIRSAAANPFISETTGFPYEVPPGNIEDFISSGKRPGAPIAANALTDAGVTNHASELRKDILGYTRDGLPDIGAYEWNATSTPPLQLNPVGNRVITAGQPITIQVSAEDAGSAVLEFSATGPD